MNSPSSPALAVQWFDGLHPVARAASVWFDAGRVCVQASDESAPRDYASAMLRWPEPLRQGQRQILLPDGGVLACPDATEYDAWLGRSGRRHGLIPRWQQNAWATLLTLALLAGSLFAGWRWGVPLAADATVQVLPQDLDHQIGTRVLGELDAHLLKRSQLTWAERNAVFDRFADAVDTALDNRALPKLTRFHLEFRDGGKALGPNAFALPGGTIVITDELVRMLADRPEAMVGVLGHELGHVKHRHGLRLTLRAGAAGLATGVLLGDFSVALASAPALLAQKSYSRDFEREADDYARTLMRGARINPAVMVSFFERMQKLRAQGDGDPDSNAFATAFSTHPADEERIAFFKK